MDTKLVFVLWSLLSISAVVKSSVNLTTGNIVTSQSSTYVYAAKWNSTKAVDGCTAQTMGSDCCTHTDAGKTEAWWQVDLQQQFVIETVHILYRDDGTLDRLAGFEIYLSNTSVFRSEERCYQDNTASLGLMTAIQNVTCTGVGQYVTIYNDRRVKAESWYSDDAILELCEVFIYGCTLGKFGNGHCNDDCLDCLSNICHPTSGICDNCAAGYHRSGDVCIPCPTNCARNTCDGSSGACTDCNGGYYGPTCMPCPTGCNTNTCDNTSGNCYQCDAGYHGAHCNFSCPANCKNDMCSMTRGQCHECKVGFYGDYCNQNCPSNCKNNVCDMANGQCAECEVGFYGDYCNQNCPSNCKNNVCDMANGQCAECDIGFFGNHCDQTCPGNCENRTCNKDSGLCIDCNDGYYGPTCTPCPTTCSTNTCDKTSGNCLECEPGFYGDMCSLMCPDNCRFEKCNMQSGQCIECISGFHGNVCDQACPDNCGNSICSIQNGQCLIPLPERQTDDTCSYTGLYTGFAILGAFLGISVCFNICSIVLFLRQAKKIKSPKDPPETFGMQQSRSETHNYEGLDVAKLDNVKNIYDSIQE